jgi:hypothetical protein
MREVQLGSRVKVLEAEIGSVESERKRVHTMLKSAACPSESERERVLKAQYEERLKDLRTQLTALKAQQQAAARMRLLHERADARLAVMAADILRQKQARIALQRQLREEQKLKRQERAQHTKEVVRLQRSASAGAQETAKLKGSLQMREAALLRKHQEIARLKAARARELALIGGGSSSASMTEPSASGARWLTDAVAMTANEAMALAAAEAALDRRAEALASLTEFTGQTRERATVGVGVGGHYSGADFEDPVRAGLEAEAAYAAALVESASQDVARFSGSMERLSSRISSLRVVPARALCQALAVEARDRRVETGRLREEVGALRGALGEKALALPLNDGDENSLAPAGLAEAETSETDEKFFQAVASMQLEYEERISLLIKEINSLQVNSVNRSTVDQATGQSTRQPSEQSSEEAAEQVGRDQGSA